MVVEFTYMAFNLCLLPPLSETITHIKVELLTNPLPVTVTFVSVVTAVSFGLTLLILGWS